MNTTTKQPILHPISEQSELVLSSPEVIEVTSEEPVVRMEKRELGEGEVRGSRFEVHVGEGAKATLDGAYQLAAGSRMEVAIMVTLEEGAEFSSTIFGQGEGELKVDRTVNVLGKGATVTETCLGLMTGKGRILATDDVKVLAESAKVNLRTRIVLGDEARSTARGRIVLTPAAMHSEARERIDHLMLGDRVTADAIPELDVQTDDVICGHGATMTRLPEEALFYFASRGVQVEEVTNLLVHGFLSFPIPTLGGIRPSPVITDGRWI